MHSGRNSGNWLARIVTTYPHQCLIVVGIVGALSIGLGDVQRGQDTAQHEGPLASRQTDDGVIISGNATVIDGDSLEIDSRSIRLWGIDAPELHQTCTRNGQPWACGTQARDNLAAHLANKHVSCRQQDIDRYDRVVAECFVDAQNINGWLVENGWAMAYRQYSTKFVPAEEEAESRHWGLWQGTFTEPWEWRRQQR